MVPYTKKIVSVFSSKSVRPGLLVHGPKLGVIKNLLRVLKFELEKSNKPEFLAYVTAGYW